MRRAALLLALAPAAALAQALAPAHDGPLAPTPAAPSAAYEQRLGAALPLAAPFTDSDGRAIRLADEFAPHTAVLLMLGYHRCPQLCGLATQGVLEALRRSGLATAAARIVFVSVDPTETPADAAARRRADLDYARLLAGDGAAPPAIDRLVGPPTSLRALAAQVGFRDAAGDAQARLAHPEAVVVATPDGRVSRYLMGVRFEPADLRTAVDDAAGNRIGALTDRLALLCAHFDPRVGLHSAGVMTTLRLVGLATLAALAGFAWRHRSPR